VAVIVLTTAVVVIVVTGAAVVVIVVVVVVVVVVGVLVVVGVIVVVVVVVGSNSPVGFIDDLFPPGTTRSLEYLPLAEERTRVWGSMGFSWDRALRISNSVRHLNQSIITIIIIIIITIITIIIIIDQHTVTH